MDIANCIVALGGDPGNTVPKYGVTAAEILVLMTIHGNEAIMDVEPCGSIERVNRDERQRLLDTYPARDSGNRQIVATMFPGAGASVPEKLADLQLDESVFAATERMKPGDAPEAVEAAPAGKSKKSKKSEKKAPATPAPAEPASDGIEDL
jgi:hypothetical protein